MSTPDPTERVWTLIEKVGVGMLTTRFSAGLRARPLEPRPDRAAGVIWFVTDARGAKDDEVAETPDVGFTLIDPDDNAYLSITGRAEVRRDPAQAAAIWRSTDNVWWPGPDDPNVRVLCLTPTVAELWDGPSSRLVAAYEFAKARLTGKSPNLGENRKATVPLR